MNLALRIRVLAFALILVLSVFAPALLVLSDQPREMPREPLVIRIASHSGDAYSGSGDWSITQATTYTDESLTVYGNVSISSAGSLTLHNADMILDEPNGGAYSHDMLIDSSASQPYFKMESGSTLTTTNATAGRYNAHVTCQGGAGVAGYFYLDNSSVSNVHFQGNSIHATHINNCTMTASIAAMYDTSPYETLPFTSYGSTWSDVDTTGNALKFVLELSGKSVVSHSTFANITTSGATTTNGCVKIYQQHDVRIDNNNFGNAKCGVYARGNGATNTLAGTLVTYNHFGKAASGTYANRRTINVFATENGTDNHFTHNTFDSLENGSIGVEVDMEHWDISYNVFTSIDGSALASEPAWMYGIKIGSEHQTITHNTFSWIRGSGVDNGSGAAGVYSHNLGYLDISYNAFSYIHQQAVGIAILDTVGGSYDRPGITIEHNTFSHIYQMANGMSIFGGDQADVGFNTISDIGGSCGGIMTDSSCHLPLVHDNTVTGMYYEPNVAPYWQIVVGAFVHYAGTTGQYPIWRDNQATGYTPAFPFYALCGAILGDGWSANARMSISSDVSFSCYILNGNVSFSLTGARAQTTILYDGSLMPYAASFYINTTADHDGHWLNVTTGPVAGNIPGGIGNMIVILLGITLVMLVIGFLLQAKRGGLDRTALIEMVFTIIIGAVFLVIAFRFVGS